MFSDDNYDGLKPVDVEKSIRASCYVGGWQLEKIDENSCRTTLILEVNLMGALPTWVMKAANVEQGSQILKLNAVVAKYCKDKPFE